LTAPALCLIGKASVRLWSHETAKRLAIQFCRAGAGKVLDENEVAAHDGPIVLVRADAVLDQPLIPILLSRLNLLLLGDGSAGKVPVAAHVSPQDARPIIELLKGRLEQPYPPHLVVRSPADLDASFWQHLRKREIPYALIADESNKQQVEWRTFMGTYKGATDVVTKRLWPVPAFFATRALASTPITPNMVTIVAGVLVFVAFFLFLHGQYLWGLVAAWLMTFLDTVDGKLARTTLTVSKWGDVLDHGIDLIHPPFWYAAWAAGLASAGFIWSTDTYWLVLAAIFGGYLLQRLMEGVAIKWLGMEIHIWRPIDTHFREITARRNPNLVILTIAALFGRPDLGLIVVAAWILVCLALHVLQLAHAFTVKARAGQLTSWMHDQSASK
jgi:phosphatidylglycerophosphate synthase